MKHVRVVSLVLPLSFLFLCIGCARQPGMQEAAPSAANFVTSNDDNNNDNHLPFDRSADPEGRYPSASLGTEEIPAGTLVSVRLLSPISSANSRAGDIFKAALAEPILVDGHQIATEGTPLTGAVLAAMAMAGTQEPGYLRLALTTIKISGQPRPIETSGVFVNGRSRYPGLAPPVANQSRLARIQKAESETWNFPPDAS